MPDLPFTVPNLRFDNPQILNEQLIDTLTQIFDAFNTRSDSERLSFYMPGDTTAVALPGIAQSGSFFLRINNEHHMAPAGCFAVAKSDVSSTGTVEQIVFSNGSGPYQGVTFQIAWPANSAPTIALNQNCPAFQINVGVI